MLENYISGAGAHALLRALQKNESLVNEKLLNVVHSTYNVLNIHTNVNQCMILH